jgi:hypothetical protein
MKYIFKAVNHKYFKREGSKGNYKYYYTEKEYNEAKSKQVKEKVKPKPEVKAVDSKKLNDIIKKHEKNIIKETGDKYEMCISIDKNGKTVLSKKGNESQIIFHKEDIDLLKGSEIFTHNHPIDRGFSLGFSIQDLIVAVSQQIKEMRAHCTNHYVNGKGSFVFKKGNLKSEDTKAFTSAYKKIDNRIEKHNHKNIYNAINKVERDLLITKYNATHADMVMNELMKTKLLKDNKCEFYFDKH